jgi:hypothetical protein
VRSRGLMRVWRTHVGALARRGMSDFASQRLWLEEFKEIALQKHCENEEERLFYRKHVLPEDLDPTLPVLVWFSGSVLSLTAWFRWFFLTLGTPLPTDEPTCSGALQTQRSSSKCRSPRLPPTSPPSVWPSNHQSPLGRHCFRFGLSLARSICR